MSTRAFSETLKSPSDMSSRSVSPVVLRPTLTPTPHQKQRSSSMNSVGSTQPDHHRSMSIVSSESPRNSIVSVDDFFVKPARNNSSSSLASLGIGSPLESTKDSYPVTNRTFRTKRKSACAIFSDEDSSEPEHVVTRTSAWRRRRSSDKVHKPDFLLSFKNNFKFKYDSYVKPKAPVANPEEPMPSPLSAAVEPHNSVFNTLDHEVLPPAARSPVTPTAKKGRSSSMTQSMFLKKKLLLSKDIQLELLASHASTTASYPAGHEIRSPSHFLTQPAPSRGNPRIHIPNAAAEPPYLSTSSSSVTTCNPTWRSPSPPQGSSSSLQTVPSALPSPPTEQTLLQQNKLISELNRKWNRAMFPASLDNFASHDACAMDYASGQMVVSKKRGRSESSSSTDSLATNYS
ncbi:hypothetical protein OXX80_009556 [Metschnikowia pulcherrima]